MDMKIVREKERIAKVNARLDALELALLLANRDMRLMSRMIQSLSNSTAKHRQVLEFLTGQRRGK